MAGSEIESLYITLSAVNAPILAAFAQTTAAGEEMAAKLKLSMAELDASMAGAGASAGMGAGVAAIGAEAEASAAKVTTAVGEMDGEFAAMAASAKAATAEISTSMAAMDAEMAAAVDKAALSNVKLGEAMKGVAAESTGVATTLGVSNNALKYTGLAAAAAGVEAVKMAGDFQASITRLNTSAGESEQNLKMVNDGILAMAGQVGYSSEELSKAMYMVESSGQHGADGLRTLQAAAQGAKTENADLTPVVEATTAAMVDYHLKSTDAATVTSKLVAATGQGRSTFEDLAKSMSSVLPIASANHIALDDILGDWASMTVHGMSAQQATQNLADTIRQLAKPNAVAAKELAALGMSATEVAKDLGEKGLSGTINEISQRIQSQMGPDGMVVVNLTNALKGLPPAVQDLGKKVLDGTTTLGAFSAEVKTLDPITAKQASSFATLAGSMHGIGTQAKSGAEVYQTYSGALRQALGDSTAMNVALMISGENTKTTTDDIRVISGATAEAGNNVKGWAEIQQTFNQKMSEAKDAVGALVISVGEKLLPIITPLIGALAAGAQWLSAHQAAATALAIVIGGALTLALSAAAVAAWGFTAAMLANPVVWIVAGIVAAAIGIGYAADMIVKHWQGVKDFFSGLVSAVTQPVQAIENLWTKFTGTIADGWHAFINWFQGDMHGSIGFLIGALIGMLLKGGEDAWHAFQDAITNAAEATWAWARAVPGRIRDFIAALPGMLWDLASSAWHSFTNGVTAAAEDTWGYLRSIPGRVIGAIGDLGHLLVNAGRSIINGLLQGIKDAYNNMISFVSNIGAGIASHKGPVEADRMLLVPHGNAIMDGLLAGLTRGHGRVQRFVQGVAGGLAGDLSTTIAAGVSTNLAGGGPLGATSSTFRPGLAAAGGGGVVINLAVQGHIWTTQDLVKEIQQELLRHGIRNNTPGINYSFA
jgi:phage-related protein